MKVPGKSIKELVNEIVIGHVFHFLVTAMVTNRQLFFALEKECLLVGQRNPTGPSRNRMFKS